MASDTRRPTGDGYESNLTGFGSGSGDYGKVNEEVEDTSNGLRSSTSDYSSFLGSMFTFSTTSLGLLTKATLYARAKKAGATDTDAQIKFRMRKSSTNYDSSAANLTTSDATYSAEFTSNLEWNNQFGVYLKSGYNSVSKAVITADDFQFWIILEYTLLLSLSDTITLSDVCTPTHIKKLLYNYLHTRWRDRFRRYRVSEGILK